MIAYTLSDGAATRPVTFAFNGGPGSSSVWLHLGLLGPRRVLSGDVGVLLPPPYDIADNHQTLLRYSDLVFIDPVSTGYSRVVKGEKPQDFHGYEGDIESVAEVIRLWTTRSGRWMSPKYLCGESYGTMRAAGLARHLQERYGMYLNGLILISAYLDGGTAEFDGGNDGPYALYLPTYAAIANYHGLHADRPLRQVLDEAEDYAGRDYLWVLARGSRLTGEERAAAVTKLARLTGLSEDYVDRVNLRPEHIRFLTELLRGQRRTVGRIDGRFAGWDSDYGREKWSTDPSIDAITGPYAAALNHYVRAELGYENDLPYESPHRPGAAVVVQGIRGRARVRAGQAGRGDTGESAHAGARGLWILRRRDALLRGRAQHRAPGDPGGPGREHRVRLLRGRSHDVPARAQQAGPVRPPRRVRDRG